MLIIVGATSTPVRGRIPVMICASAAAAAAAAAAAVAGARVACFTGSMSVSARAYLLYAACGLLMLLLHVQVVLLLYR